MSDAPTVPSGTQGPWPGATWRPLVWVTTGSGDALRYDWIARIEHAKCGQHGQAYAPDASGKVWLTSSTLPTSLGMDGQLIEGEMNGGHHLRILLMRTWREVEYEIRLAGEDPLTLPFRDFVPSALLSEDRLLRYNAICWTVWLPKEISTQSEILAALNTLKDRGDQRAIEVLLRLGVSEPPS